MISSHFCKRGRPDKMDNGAGVLCGHMSPSFDLVVVFECNDHTPYHHDSPCGKSSMRRESQENGGHWCKRCTKLVGTVVNSVQKLCSLFWFDISLNPGCFEIARKYDMWARYKIIICGDLLMMTSSNGNVFRVPCEGNHKGQWCLALIFSFLCTWTHGWASSRDAGDLRRPSAHYDVTVMLA